MKQSATWSPLFAFGFSCFGDCSCVLHNANCLSLCFNCLVCVFWAGFRGASSWANMNLEKYSSKVHNSFQCLLLHFLCMNNCWKCIVYTKMLLDCFYFSVALWVRFPGYPSSIACLELGSWWNSSMWPCGAVGTTLKHQAIIIWALQSIHIVACNVIFVVYSLTVEDYIYICICCIFIVVATLLTPYPCVLRHLRKVSDVIMKLHFNKNAGAQTSIFHDPLSDHIMNTNVFTRFHVPGLLPGDSVRVQKFFSDVFCAYRILLTHTPYLGFLI